MPLTSEIDETHNLLVLRGTGNVTERDSLGVIDRLVEEKDGSIITKDVLFLLDDHASLHEIDLETFMHVKDRVEAWLKIYPRADIRCALVAAGAAEFAVADLWRAVTDVYPSLHSRTRTFRTEAEARAWLGA
jgi:hypothetical protein